MVHHEVASLLIWLRAGFKSLLEHLTQQQVRALEMTIGIITKSMAIISTKKVAMKDDFQLLIYSSVTSI